MNKVNDSRDGVIKQLKERLPYTEPQKQLHVSGLALEVPLVLSGDEPKLKVMKTSSCNSVF